LINAVSLKWVLALNPWLANCYFASLAPTERPKMPSGANVFEISDIQEEESEVLYLAN
jgi:hypothetical protein